MEGKPELKYLKNVETCFSKPVPNRVQIIKIDIYCLFRILLWTNNFSVLEKGLSSEVSLQFNSKTVPYQ